MREGEEHWTVHLGFDTTEKYVKHMSETGAWGSTEYQKKFMERKAKKKKNQ